MNATATYYPRYDAGYDRLFSAALEIANVPSAEMDEVFSPRFYKDLRMVILVSAYALENSILSSAESYRQMQDLCADFRTMLENPKVKAAMPTAEYEKFKTLFLDFADVVCGIVLQRDKRLHDFLAGEDNGDLAGCPN